MKDVDIEMGMNDSMKVTPVHAVAALDPESARAVCAMILTTLFVARTVRNFGGDLFKPKKVVGVRYGTLPPVHCHYSHPIANFFIYAGLNEKTKTQ